MRKFEYTPSGVCAKKIVINYTVEKGKGPVVMWIDFEGGCPGHSAAVANLCAGKPASEIIPVLAGIRCGNRQTSCPDQLAAALTSLRKLVDDEHQGL